MEDEKKTYIRGTKVFWIWLSDGPNNPLTGKKDNYGTKRRMRQGVVSVQCLVEDILALAGKRRTNLS